MNYIIDRDGKIAEVIIGGGGQASYDQGIKILDKLGIR